MSLTGTHFITAGRKEGLDKEGTKEEANTNEEMKSIDERSAPLWPKCEHQEDTVGGDEYSITEELMEE